MIGLTECKNRDYGFNQVLITMYPNSQQIRSIQYDIDEKQWDQDRNGNKIDNRGIIKQYRLLDNAFKQLVEKTKGLVKCQTKRVITLQNGSQMDAKLTQTDMNVELQSDRDLKNLNQSQKEQLLLDLMEQLEQLHSMDLLVGHFDLNYLGINKRTNTFCLIVFPNLTTVDEILQRGYDSALRFENAVRSQFIWNGMSKATDYLSLLKNFFIKFIDPKNYNQYQENDIGAILKERIYLEQKIQFGSRIFFLHMQCRSSQCDCQNSTFDNYLACMHRTRSYSFNLSNQKIFDIFYTKCAKQLKREEEQIAVKSKIALEKRLKVSITNKFYEIFNNTNEITVEQVQILKNEVNELFFKLSQVQNEEERQQQEIKNKEGLADIDEYIQLLQNKWSAK